LIINGADFETVEDELGDHGSGKLHPARLDGYGVSISPISPTFQKALHATDNFEVDPRCEYPEANRLIPCRRSEVWAF
jgi:hypothetical protein